MLNKEASSTIFFLSLWYDLTGIEPWSPGPLVNTTYYIHIYGQFATIHTCTNTYSLSTMICIYIYLTVTLTTPVVVMPWTILPRRNRRCALSATSTWKSEEEKNARGVTCFMEENKISLCEVMRFDEHKRD